MDLTERGPGVRRFDRPHAGRIRHLYWPHLSDSRPGDATYGACRPTTSDARLHWPAKEVDFAMRRRGWIVAAMVAAAAVAALVVGRSRNASTPAELATFPVESLSPDLRHAPGAADAVRELVEAGAAQFDARHYAEAARTFRAALAHDSARADVAYLAGLSTGLARDAGAAVPDPETAGDG